MKLINETMMNILGSIQDEIKTLLTIPPVLRSEKENEMVNFYLFALYEILLELEQKKGGIR
jgi:hypothetical protein